MTEIDTGALMALMKDKGVDPGIIAMLDKNKDGWGDGGLILILFLLILFGGNGFGGFGKDGTAATKGDVAAIVSADSTYAQLMDAISTQGVRQEMAVNALASSLGTSISSINGALSAMDKQIAINQGSIVNAIQASTCTIGHQISDCCCKTQTAIERSNNSIIQAIQAQTIAMNEGFCNLEKRDLKLQLDNVRDKLAEQAQAAQTAQIIAALKTSSTTSGSA